MKENSVANIYQPEPVSFTRNAIARWIRRGKHLRRHPFTKVSLAFRRVLGGPDYLSELIFWENVLSSRPSWLFDGRKRASAFPECVRSRLAELRATRPTPVKVLEVGSGPVSILADGVDEGTITVLAVDPLALLYRKLLRAHDIAYPIVPVKGCGEELCERFKDERFDVVYSSNALDHTRSPRKCVMEMSGVLSRNGLMVLEGFEREGSNADWAGLHQHDLLVEDGHLMRYDRRGQRENLTEGLGLECLHQRVVQFKERGIHGFGYELPPDTPADAWKWNSCNWYTAVFRKR